MSDNAVAVILPGMLLVFLAFTLWHESKEVPTVSRTRKQKKGTGYEYWGTRYPYPLPPGKYSKRMTKRRERQQAKKEADHD